MVERPTAYVAGPYSGRTEIEIQRHILDAAHCASWLWDEGYDAFCPHMNTAGFHTMTNQPYQVYMNFSFKVLRSGLIDLLVCTGDWTSSSGVKDEYDECLRLQIPIYEWQPHQLELVRVGSQIEWHLAEVLNV